MPANKTCINCGNELERHKGLWLCPDCNSNEFPAVEDSLDAARTFEDSDEYVFIECPGATLYEPGTTVVTSGAKFNDENDPSKGCQIVGQPVFAPTHTQKRRIKREALGKIRRCQGCQDYTIRMRRPEGPDFFIPSTRFPNRKKLKSVTHTSVR